MDVQLMDENGESGYTMQHQELEMVIEYAEKWAEISNKELKNKRVIEILKSFKFCIGKWHRDRETH